MAQVFSQLTFNVINDIYFIGFNLTSLRLECIHCWPSNSCDIVAIAWACAVPSLEWMPAAWKEIPETTVEPSFITQALNDTEFEVVWKSTDILNSDSKRERFRRNRFCMWRSFRNIFTYLFTSPDANSWLIGKDLDSGKDWRQKRRVRQDETVGWHHQFNRHELGQTPGDGQKQGSLACCSPRGRRVRHNLGTEQQQWSSFVKYKTTTTCRGCTHWTVYARHTGTNLCDRTCQRTFSSLKVCNLKVCM